ncbi:UxaA family hydrolase [Thermogemmatispora sp.]|jgi:(2R)-sulfolactate sulfo-lyase subunit alpha|uniref:UxaA family hydrolase n=1 Tax=Thermogemmatispora sp. TaxID=1968838 RepID=UPI0035E418A9
MSHPESQAPEEQPVAPAAPGFLIHNEGDHVAVAVRDITPGQHQAVYMDSEREVTITVLEAIPLGHKVALSDLAEGERVIEYGLPIGLTRRPIRAGQHVHTHNIRSARWQNSL